MLSLRGGKAIVTGKTSGIGSAADQIRGQTIGVDGGWTAQRLARSLATSHKRKLE
jgi:hypothetical protein